MAAPRSSILTPEPSAPGSPHAAESSGPSTPSSPSSMALQSTSPSRSSTPSTIPDGHLTLRQCPHSTTPLVGIHRTQNRYALFEYRASCQKLVFHKCLCQETVTEDDLHPRYSVTLHDEVVIWVQNVITGKAEQYVFDEGRLSQVMYKDLVYDKNKKSKVVAMIPIGEDCIVVQGAPGIQKKLYKFGIAIDVPATPVKTLMMKLLEGSKVSYYGQEDGISPKLSLTFCPHSEINLVRVDSSPLSFAYQISTGSFEPFECSACSVTIQEEDLTPKYVSYHLGTFVIHAYNTVTKKVEQFVLERDGSLQHVWIPEVSYDSEKDNDSSTLLMNGNLLVYRDDNGKMKKEKWNEEAGKYEELEAMPVRKLRRFEARPKKCAHSKSKYGLKDSLSEPKINGAVKRPSPSSKEEGVPAKQVKIEIEEED